MRITLLTLAIAMFTILTGLTAEAQSGRLPTREAPNGLHSIDGAKGGRLLVGSLPRQPSTDAAFRAALKLIRSGYFDAAPNLTGAVRSKDGSVTIGLFTAALGNSPIAGSLYTIVDPNGAVQVGALFNSPSRFGASFKPLMTDFIERIPAPAASSELKEVFAPDGTEAVTIPGNWQIQSLQKGQVIVRGPDKAQLVIRFLTDFTDTRYAKVLGTTHVPFTTDPAEALNAVAQAIARGNNFPAPIIHVERAVPESKPQGVVTSAWLHGTVVQEGQPTMRFETLVQITPLDGRGIWHVQFNQKSAPVGVFQRDLPVLTKIYNSYKYDSRRMASNIIQDAQARLDANNQVFERSMQSAAAIQGNIDRSTRAFVDYISDHARVSDGRGEIGRFTTGTAQAIVDSDPQNFHIMALNEYR